MLTKSGMNSVRNYKAVSWRVCRCGSACLPCVYAESWLEDDVAGGGSGSYEFDEFGGAADKITTWSGSLALPSPRPPQRIPIPGTLCHR